MGDLVSDESGVMGNISVLDVFIISVILEFVAKQLSCVMLLFSYWYTVNIHI